ncbi:MJ0042 family finger-like protein [Desulfatibacillum aliphaticivorans]|uniref:MJ0042 family finger-like protein n=1 Tax=Desulfatibacillum aliphaticivorans TaxID=218208 RepID=B8FJ62_DESAL|nr:zinc-ribbon domain-containing protein [Desulfatibacillum aliphaticivorans]ACL04989.1 MJ0042 family finger-like protein [Desulfatibacillum aliphaticivorans]
MNITCQHCQGQFRIPDEKVPKGQSFSLGCPKCKKKITVNAEQSGSAAPAAPPKGAQAPPQKGKTSKLMDEISSRGYDADDKPFDFLEEGARTALLCELDPVYKAKIKDALNSLGYLVTEPGAAREALKQMRFHVFDIIVLNEMFDTDEPENNHVLKFLSRMVISTRRKIFVALVSNNHRTMDNMAAFAKSVNITVNPSGIDDIDKILTRAIAENTLFYKIFMQAMEEAGRV